MNLEIIMGSLIKLEEQHLFLSDNKMLFVRGGEQCSYRCVKVGFTITVPTYDKCIKCISFCESVNNTMQYCVVYNQGNTEAIFKYYPIS